MRRSKNDEITIKSDQQAEEEGNNMDWWLDNGES